MTLDHLSLVVGIGAFALIFVTLTLFNLIKKMLRAGKDKFQRFLDALDTLKFLPLMWIITVVGIGYWLVTRVIISYQ